MQKNPKKHLKNKKRWFFYSNSAPRLRNHQKYTKIFALNHDLLNFFLQVWYILDATWWILMCNLRLAFIQLPSSLQMRPLRLFKQVIWGDIWQLPLEWCTTKKVRQDREHREDGQEKHDWHLNLTSQGTSVGQLSQLCDVFHWIHINRMICVQGIGHI